MSRTARLWKGAGALALGGLMLSGASAYGDDMPTPLADQLLGLGQQALQQGNPEQAVTFLRKSLQLNPDNNDARRLLADPALNRVAMQVPDAVADDLGDVPPPPPADLAGEVPTATLEEAARLERVRIQRLMAMTRERMARARDQLNAGQPQEALTNLRLALTTVQEAAASGEVPPAVGAQLERELQVNIQSTVRREEAIELERAEAMRLQLAASQRAGFFKTSPRAGRRLTAS